MDKRTHIANKYTHLLLKNALFGYGLNLDKYTAPPDRLLMPNVLHHFQKVDNVLPHIPLGLLPVSKKVIPSEIIFFNIVVPYIKQFLRDYGKFLLKCKI